MRWVCFLTIFFCFSTNHVHTKSFSENASDPIKEGNFALKASQQPSSVFTFGQNVISSGDISVYAPFTYCKGKNNHEASIDPYAIYGLSDSMSILFTIPITIDAQSNCSMSSGIGDINVQFEGYVLEYASEYVSNTISVVSTITLPTGSTTKNPSLGESSVTFFLGTVLSHVTTYWNYWVSPGIIFPTSQSNQTQNGKTVFYQGGIGRIFAAKPDTFIVTGFIEFLGTYNEKNTILGTKDPNSGGNSIFIGPSFWFSTNQFIFYGGIIFPIFESLNGTQNKNSYQGNIGLGWTF